MPLMHAAVLGALQGLGEFLPISSSGHLIVVPWLLGWTVQPLAFDVALHLGTLAAVLLAFADDWRRLLTSAIRGTLRGRPFAEPEGRLLGLLALASVPGAVAGLLLEEWADTMFRSPGLVAVDMAIMGAVLLYADHRASTSVVSGRALAARVGARLPAARPAPRGGDAFNVSFRDAMLIGCAQALAIVPGVSRSGATITMALLLGHRREEAARFSFLLATPITLGAALHKVPHLLAGGDPNPVLVGMLTAAIFGFLSIRVLLAYVRARDYRPFAFYRFAFAVLVGAVLLVRA